MVASFFESIHRFCGLRRLGGRRLWIYELLGAIWWVGFVLSKTVRRFAQIDADGGLALAWVWVSGAFRRWWLRSLNDIRRFRQINAGGRAAFWGVLAWVAQPGDLAAFLQRRSADLHRSTQMAVWRLRW
ncbi:hypothetical protein T5B8_09099 [Salinisphaera sp. T5B8]